MSFSLFADLRDPKSGSWDRQVDLKRRQDGVDADFDQNVSGFFRVDGF